ncbi:hypothetical protein SAMN05660293_00708 [Dyadobacter psychrophilus]|uniref:Uncharacterized protein n=1 Tax=Dyadobacter psychrophilus TaxID=651661 RepID=A0A1T5BXL6_9BACT|nr:hypothetical protein SAMN05660293_00708 [Dyadobacter psychrophilus]
MRFLLSSILLLSYFESSPGTMFDARNRETKNALHAIRIDTRALKKLGYSKDHVECALSSCSATGYLPQGESAISNIFLNRLCVNLNIVYENLPYAKLNKKKVLRIARKYKKLK